MSSDEQNGEGQDTLEEVTPEEAPKPVDPRDLYYVHNVTRGRHNRTLRATQPKHHGMKQYLGGGKYRSVRGRPIVLSDSQVFEHLEELKAKVGAGIFELRTQDGRIVDINTGRAAPRGESKPLPRQIPDSIANDTQNVGQQMPQYPGGDVEGQPGAEPSLITESDRDELPPPPVVPPPPAADTQTTEVTPPAADPVTDEASTEELPDLVGDEPEAPKVETSKSMPPKGDKKKGGR
jgi:hypothetical protein